MNILITGSDGFIAKELIDFFNRDGEHHLITVNRHQLNLLNEKNVNTFFEWNKGNIDAVIHTAVVGGNRLTIDGIDVFFDNIIMFRNVLMNVKKHNLLLFNFTSGAENLNSIYEPYGASKAAISNIIDTIAKNIINLKVFNCFGKYGLKTRFIESNITNYKNGEDIVIHKNRLFDFFYSEDIYKIICYWIDEYKNGAINTEKIECTYHEILSLKDVAEIINNLDDKKVDIKIIEPGMSIDYIGDNYWWELNKFNIVGLEEGIRRLYGEKT